ncbi:hypothetical protein KCV87_25700 [Actinosynnema pretiosum subsp. pretiosum]|uniref:Uncharacterized protein n=1 Tax=Actinosynnema pretiosum subsp. pretiosum TaxID=103721 RepID=A0AA45L3T8_9PSEU|nr:hypothetical protein APASM_6000 [Actinosynnema pretiosum subsp. pretiosum]QUF02817.1 hypothetical protein KCV87_25700 [Actinosynnema pretiosum subsp. pretiosum]
MPVGLSWWSWLHLLARDPREPPLRRSPVGLLLALPAVVWIFPPIVLPPLVLALVPHVRGGQPKALLATAAALSAAQVAPPGPSTPLLFAVSPTTAVQVVGLTARPDTAT